MKKMLSEADVEWGRMLVGEDMGGKEVELGECGEGRMLGGRMLGGKGCGVRRKWSEEGC